MKLLQLLEGGIRYLTGPNVSTDEADRRFASCRRCSSLQWGARHWSPVAGAYCGKPVEGNPDGSECGCLLGWAWRSDVAEARAAGASVNITVSAKAIGKTQKVLERCPRGKWQ